MCMCVCCVTRNQGGKEIEMLGCDDRRGEKERERESDREIVGEREVGKGGGGGREKRHF